ncbi:hypothetical protein Barb6_02705 [Bacteroidales bacterium Barb6]|nr:hypothetical protein Barb6_02705 [Bacteroidales bacterium Barb6]
MIGRTEGLCIKEGFGLVCSAVHTHFHVQACIRACTNGRGHEVGTVNRCRSSDTVCLRKTAVAEGRYLNLFRTTRCPDITKADGTRFFVWV